MVFSDNFYLKNNLLCLGERNFAFNTESTPLNNNVWTKLCILSSVAEEINSAINDEIWIFYVALKINYNMLNYFIKYLTQ